LVCAQVLNTVSRSLPFAISGDEKESPSEDTRLKNRVLDLRWVVWVVGVGVVGGGWWVVGAGGGWV
jgi:hypothetical protein